MVTVAQSNGYCDKEMVTVIMVTVAYSIRYYNIM
jgi:hypothetical protein